MRLPLPLCIYLAALTLSSCAGTTDEPDSGSDAVTITAVVHDTDSRAELGIPDGYSLRCILQLVDSNGKTVGRYSTRDIVRGKADFRIPLSQCEASSAALLWADYTDAAGQSAYNAGDLLAVGYRTTGFDMSIIDFPQQLDAFCGMTGTISDHIEVTLTRPFTNLRFCPNNPEVFAGVKSLGVTLDAPSGYSVLTGYPASSTRLTFENKTFNAADTPWFSTLLFASADASTLESDIVLTFTGDETFQITIPSGFVPLRHNYQLNIYSTIDPAKLKSKAGQTNFFF